IWELTGMSCKHVVAAICNMAAHGKEVGIPKDWVAQCYWLNTWKDMYQYKVVKKMVKGGKMSRKGTIMSCGKCGGKGHDRKGCTDPRDKGCQDRDPT
nr:hypothetical protein [Tanacetum cinerariifolium]